MGRRIMVDQSGRPSIHISHVELSELFNALVLRFLEKPEKYQGLVNKLMPLLTYKEGVTIK